HGKDRGARRRRYPGGAAGRALRPVRGADDPAAEAVLLPARRGVLPRSVHAARRTVHSGHPSTLRRRLSMDHGGTGAGRRGRRLVMWDIDMTLMRANGVAAEAFLETLSAMTGRPASDVVTWGGRTDLDTATELFAAHGVAAPDFVDFFARY